MMKRSPGRSRISSREAEMRERGFAGLQFARVVEMDFGDGFGVLAWKWTRARCLSGAAERRS